ncbi:MAG: hypothetical protein LBK83_00230 [Treponema sp.]|jgi:hypothetical protein|nr:hypothetical protein [Treponema sp.]
MNIDGIFRFIGALGALGSIGSLIFTILEKDNLVQNITGILLMLFLAFGIVFGFVFVLFLINKNRSLVLQKENEVLTSRNEMAGIIRLIQQRRDIVKKNPENMSDKLQNARRIKIFLTTGLGFFETNYRAIQQAIHDNEAEAQVIIANKESEFLEAVAQMETKVNKRTKNMIIQNEIDEVKNKLVEINDIIKKEKNTGKEYIKIKYFNTEFRLSMILIESKNGERWGWVTLTLPPLKAVDTFSFEIESKNQKDDNIYNQCNTHFDAVWERLKTEVKNVFYKKL